MHVFRTKKGPTGKDVDSVWGIACAIAESAAVARTWGRDGMGWVRIFFWVWSCLFGLFGWFLLFGRRRAPRPNSKKRTRPNSKKKPPPLCLTSPQQNLIFSKNALALHVRPAPATIQKKHYRPNSVVWADGVFVFWLFGRAGEGRVCFFAVWGAGAGGQSLFFLPFGRVRVHFFSVWAGCMFIVFAVWAGGRFFWLSGRGTGVHSLTGLPGSALRGPTTKTTKQQNKKHGFRTG